MSNQEPKTYRVEIRLISGSTPFGDWPAEPTWTILQFDLKLPELPALVAHAVSVDKTADMEVTDDIAQPPVSIWKGDAAAFDIMRWSEYLRAVTNAEYTSPSEIS